MITLNIIFQVWNRATQISGYDPSIWRQDFAGAWIRFDSYGNKSKYGWCVGRFRPLSAGGTDNIDNLIVLHWQNNLVKGNDFPQFKTGVTSNGESNIEKIRIWQAQ